METPTWLYYGAFLEEPAKQNLLEYVSKYVGIDPSWKVYCDHMTIIYNDGSENAQQWADTVNSMVGNLAHLMVTHVGVSDRCIAVKVTGLSSNNANPHITVAVAPGARPVESNQITNWRPVEDGIGLTAKINVAWKMR